MAAWIRACPNDHYECEKKGKKIKRYIFFSYNRTFTNKYRRLLFSQDAHEIYITIGEYGEGYEEYLRTTKPTDEAKMAEPSFLTMYQYGPWDTTSKSQTRNVAILLLACTLGEIPKPKDKSKIDDPFQFMNDDKGEGSGKGKKAEYTIPLYQ